MASFFQPAVCAMVHQRPSDYPDNDGMQRSKGVTKRAFRGMPKLYLVDLKMNTEGARYLSEIRGIEKPGSL
jgi:hypothetical protein